MGGSSGGGNTTTVQQADPWVGQQPYLKYGFTQAQDQYKNHMPQYYPENTVTDLSPTTQTSMGLQTKRALMGNPVQNAANTQLQSTIKGDYLNSNPYLDSMFNKGANSLATAYNDTVRGNTAGFTAGGRLGSGMQAFYNNRAQETLASGLGNLATETYGNNYAQERKNQLGAIDQGMPYVNQDYTDLSKLSDVGAARDTHNQAVRDASIDRWNFNQNIGMNRLAQYMGLVQGNYGSDVMKSTNTPRANTTMNDAGGLAALGAGLYSSM